MILTVLCIAGGLLIAAGIIPTRTFHALNVVLPLGAIFFGFFLLSRWLEAESDRFVVEQESTMHATDASREQSPPATEKNAH
jgi:hypothetical protein